MVSLLVQSLLLNIRNLSLILSIVILNRNLRKSRLLLLPVSMAVILMRMERK